jgi:hypothetical protein
MHVLEKDTAVVLRELKEEVLSLRHTIHQAVSQKAETSDLVALTETIHLKPTREDLYTLLDEFKKSTEETLSRTQVRIAE